MKKTLKDFGELIFCLFFGAMIQDYLRLMRPHQWVKNVFILLPVFFGVRITEIRTLMMAMTGVAAFSCIASAVYIFNDWRDIKVDRLHPTKKYRPLAAELIPIRGALILMGVLLAVGMSILAWYDHRAFHLGLVYIGMNLLYSVWLKHISLLDIFVIALGFVIRLGIGSTIVDPNIPLSMWIVVMTFLGALFLGLAKRRDDVLLAAEGLKVRRSVKSYNLPFVNGGMVMMASVLIVGYLSYVSNPETMDHFQTENLYFTGAFVILGVLRYMQITFVEQRSGNPTRILLSDRFLQITIAGWLATFIWLIYLG